MSDHMPGYEAADKDDATKGGKLGDVEVRFTVTPSTDNAYQNNLDAVLPENADAPADEKVDLFLIEADYALKYVNTPVALPVADLGITEDELANQYQYTKDIVTDADGNLKGLTWQGCPGVLIYNRDIAKEVLGSDDPEEVQKAVADWDTFNKTAAALKEKGYRITSTVNDSYRVFSNNVSSPWVVDGKINVDDSIKAWVDMSKAQVDAGETGTADLWSDDWSKGFAKDADVFCYFGPAWLINFSMGNVDDGNNEDDGSRTFAGGWGATVGPQGFYWGGTWICAAAGTDNPSGLLLGRHMDLRSGRHGQPRRGRRDHETDDHQRAGPDRHRQDGQRLRQQQARHGSGRDRRQLRLQAPGRPEPSGHVLRRRRQDLPRQHLRV